MSLLESANRAITIAAKECDVHIKNQNFHHDGYCRYGLEKLSERGKNREEPWRSMTSRQHGSVYSVDGGGKSVVGQVQHTVPHTRSLYAITVYVYNTIVPRQCVQ